MAPLGLVRGLISARLTGRTLRELLELEQTLVVGASCSPLQAAGRAGLRTLGVAAVVDSTQLVIIGNLKYDVNVVYCSQCLLGCVFAPFKR
mgnify:CR=1 FL=1